MHKPFMAGYVCVMSVQTVQYCTVQYSTVQYCNSQSLPLPRVSLFQTFSFQPGEPGVHIIQVEVADIKIQFRFTVHCWLVKDSSWKLSHLLPGQGYNLANLTVIKLRYSDNINMFNMFNMFNIFLF